MTSLYKDGAETRGRSHSGARTAIFFLFWVLLVLAQLGLLISSAQEGNGKLVKSLPRRARLFDSQSLHVPPSQARSKNVEGDPDTVYGDDKRVIHTGPNPLHN